MAHFTFGENTIDISLQDLKTLLGFLTDEDLEELQVFIDKLLEE